MKLKLKRVIIVGTIAFVITITPNLSGYLTNTAFAANPSKPSSQKITAARPKDELAALLGLTSDKSVYDELLQGRSLADIAETNRQDVQGIIDLQVGQMRERLTFRLLQGHLSKAAYLEQVKELPDLIADSVHHRYASITSE